jgi:hypothetical protein
MRLHRDSRERCQRSYENNPSSDHCLRQVHYSILLTSFRKGSSFRKKVLPYQSFKFLDTKLVSRLKCGVCKHKTSQPAHHKKAIYQQQHRHRSILAAYMKRGMYMDYNSKHPGVNSSVPTSKLTCRIT